MTEYQLQETTLQVHTISQTPEIPPPTPAGSQEIEAAPHKNHQRYNHHLVTSLTAS